MYAKKWSLPSIILLLCLSLVALGETGQFYDEVYDESGKPRPYYIDAAKAFEEMSEKERAKFREETMREFRGRNAINPLPRILTESERNEVTKGARQRARALQAFLEDHYSGKQTYRNKVIPDSIIEELLDRTGERALEPYLTKKESRKFRYIYGPDLIRDKEGTWRVLEDNLGYVGGMGDLLRARALWEKRMPEISAGLEKTNEPNQFYDQIIGRFQEQAKPKLSDTGGAFVVWAPGNYGDSEEMDLHDILKGRGATLVTPHTRNKKIVVKKDGAYLEIRNENGNVKLRKKIGFLYLNAEHTDFEWNHPALREKALLMEANDILDDKGVKKKKRAAVIKALERDPVTRKIDLVALEKAIDNAEGTYLRSASSRQQSLIPGLFDAILDGRVQTNYTPGMEFLGDKMFHSYVEDLIRFYLNEEPILRNAVSERFVDLKDGKPVFKDELHKEIAENREQWVLKTVDGRGGDGVWVGPKVSDKEWASVLEKVKEQPSRYISQQFTHLSVHGDSIVDLRALTIVDETGKMISSNTPWARSIRMEGGDGKVNLSLNGSENAVIVVPDGFSCQQNFAKVAPRRPKK